MYNPSTALSTHHPMNTTALAQDRVTSFDGTQLHLQCLKQGSANATPIVFLHALAMQASMWGRLVEHVNVDAPIWGLDLRGHGASDHPPGPYSSELFARDVLAVLDHLKAPQVHLVGCSMGGTVSMAFTGRHPTRVKSLGLIDTTACYGENAKDAWEKRGQQGHRQGLASLRDFQVERWFSPEFTQTHTDVVEECLNVFVANTPSAYLETCRMLGAADEREFIKNYQGACTIVVGEEDYATPVSMAQELATLLPQADLHILKNVRHYSPVQAPEMIAPLLLNLFKKA